MFAEGLLWKQLDVQKYPAIMRMTKRRFYSHIYGVFLAQVIIKGVLFVVDMRCSRMYCVLNIGYPFQPEYRCNHWPRPISEGHRRVLSTGSMWKTSIHLPWMGIWTNISRSTICFTNRIPPLLANLKALNFQQWILKPFEYHFQLSPFPSPTCYTTFLVCNATSQQMWS